MKKILPIVFLVASLPMFAQSTDTLPIAIDTIGQYEIGDQHFYVIADKLDSLYTNVRIVVEQVKDANPQSGSDWVKLFLELLASGILASLVTQFIKVFNMLKGFVIALPKSRWLVIIISSIVGFGWLYFLDGLDQFTFENLFNKIASVYFIAQTVFLSGLTAWKQDKYKEAKAIKYIEESENDE